VVEAGLIPETRLARHVAGTSPLIPQLRKRQIASNLEV